MADGVDGGIEEAAGAVVAQCLAHRVRRLNRQVTAAFNEALAGSPLTVTEMHMLAPVAALGGIQPAALAQAMAMDKSTLSRNVKRLVERGLIDVGPHPDGRGDALWITAAGRAALADALPAWRSAQARVEALLSGPVPELRPG